MFLSSMIVYSVIMAYTTFCAIYIVVIQIKNPTQSLKLGNNVFTNLVISTTSTVGLYFFMSFLYLDPWHMFTSSAQYFALLPSYICTLQVYAFCNTHDITWGTKGDNVVHTDLGAAVGAGGKTVELDMPSEQLDIDSGYDAALRNLRDRIEVPVPPISEAQQQEDYYRAVRTYMVVSWMVTNAILAMAVSEAYDSTNISSNFYLSCILWSVAALALFRACGSSTFGIINVVHAVAEGKMKLSLMRLRFPDWVSDASSGNKGGRSWFGNFFSRSGGGPSTKAGSMR